MEGGVWEMTDLSKRDDALLPCPFCGGDKNIICRTDYDGRDAYAVSCRYHECHGSIFTLGYGYFADKAEAIAAWNTRALPTVDPAAIREAALREAAIACQSVLVDAKSNNMPQMAIGAAQCRESILSLIGETK